jgi:mono/diheme cytochrome c family protein
MASQLRSFRRGCLLGVFLALMGSAPARAADPAPLAELSFPDAKGQRVAWKDCAGRNATVVVFLSFDCPMSTSYAKPLADLAAASDGKGVKFVAFCPTDEEPAKVAGAAAEYKLGFPVFKDEKLRAADALGATTMPQVFVLGAKGEVQYRGLIDDGYSERLVPNQKVTQRYLESALAEVLAGKAVSVAKTDPLGCKIARPRAEAKAGGPTYYKDVLPVLQRHCQVCHRPGEVGPFPLMEYSHAVAWADDIKKYTQNRRMPPWKPRDGKEFIGDRRMSEKEIDTLAKWVEGDCPKGDPKDAPAPVKFPQGWILGKPDLVLEMPDDFVLGPTGKDVFRVFVLPTGLTEDKYVTAFQVRPGNPRIVHHAVNFYDTTGSAMKSQELARAAEKKLTKPGDVDIGAGFTSGMLPGIRLNPADLFAAKPPYGPLGGWAPGIVPREMASGTGLLLPKGSDVVMQLHYHRNGKLEKDRTQLGLYFAKKPVERTLSGMAVPGKFKLDKKGEGLGYIPAGERNFVARGSWYALEDCTIQMVMPHMHLLGKSVKITMTPPKGKTETIIDVPEWDYNWQEVYFLKEPLKVPAGTRFEIEAVFDNSASNPKNPHSPPIDVKFGEQTTDEMLFGMFGATKDNPKNGLPHVISQGPFRLR